MLGSWVHNHDEKTPKSAAFWNFLVGLTDNKQSEN